MSDNAIVGLLSKFTSLADGTVRLMIDVQPEDMRADFYDLHCQVAIAKLGPEVGIGANDEPADPLTAGPPAASGPDPEWGHKYSILHANGFFRAPAVWEAIGANYDYLLWLRDQKCWLRDKDCHGDIVAAHVRITDAEQGLGDAGKGEKPKWSAVPLCDAHHRTQHERGYGHLRPETDWVVARVKYATKYAVERLRAVWDVESLREVDPLVFDQWCDENGVGYLLPEGWPNG